MRRAHRREVDAAVPDLVYAEVAQALVGYVRHGALRRTEAAEVQAYVARLPLRVVPLGRVAAAALELALARSVSAYDGCYLGLALAEDALLVTADRKLAAAATRSELLAG